MQPASSPRMFFSRGITFAHRFRIAACLCSLVFSLRASPWPEVDSDLPSDPNLAQGTLPNGVRYLILPNAEPQDRVSLRLVVAVGSLHENEEERGLAHFVEHMAFRGTRSHPAGSLTAALQRLGVGIGPDSAAFTFYDHTVFHLELPDKSPATLREGLEALREFASEVTFDEKMIERERGVVLSELATRDTPGARSSTANLAFLWPDSRHARRPVGGSAQTVRAFTREQFVSFYDAWYRPERLAIVVVGNIDPVETVPLLADHLGTLAARGPGRAEPDDLSPTAASRPDVQIFSDPGLIGTLVTLAHPVPFPPGRDTHSRRVQWLHQSLAFRMFHQRLEEIAHEPGTSFIGPAAHVVTSMSRAWQLATFSVSGKIDDWKLVAADIEREHRRAFQFGFTAKELEIAKAGFTASYEQSVRTSKTWPSRWVADRLVAALVNGTVFVTPTDAQRDMAAAIASASLDDCLEAFRQTWTPVAPHVFISAHPSFRITRQQIAAVLNESRARAVTPRAEATAPATFAYEDFGAAGTLVHDEHVADLDVRLARFANGVRLNFKQTTFEADTVEVLVRVGEGKLLQPESRPGLDLLANYAVTAGGLGRHTAQELARVLAGRALSISFRTGSDACTFAVRCARRELLLSLQLLTAFLTDAAYRPELMRDARASFGSMYASLAAMPSGPISVHAWRNLAGEDRRFGVAVYDELFSRTLDEVKAWLDPQFRHGPIEMSVVGDVPWDEASAAVGRTLGALGARKPRTLPDSNSTMQPPVAPARATIFPIEPALKQCAIAWFWPVPPIKDIREERRMRLLGLVLDDRCRVRIREELGAAYTTSAGFSESRGFPHLTAFSLFTEVAPAHAQKAMEIIQREAAQLVKTGVPPEEFERIRQPFLRSRSDDLRTNVYWGYTVLGDVQQYPDRLAAARDRAADTAAITAAELSRLARLHLNPARAFRFATVPTAPAAPASASTAAGSTADRLP